MSLLSLLGDVKLERVGVKYVSKVSNMDSLKDNLENELKVLNDRTSLKKKQFTIKTGKRKGQKVDEIRRMWGNIDGRNEIKVFLKCKNRKIYLSKEMGENREDIIIGDSIDGLKKWIKNTLKQIEGRKISDLNLYWYVGEKNDKKLEKVGN